MWRANRMSSASGCRPARASSTWRCGIDLRLAVVLAHRGPACLLLAEPEHTALPCRGPSAFFDGRVYRCDRSRRFPMYEDGQVLGRWDMRHVRLCCFSARMRRQGIAEPTDTVTARVDASGNSCCPAR